MRNTIIKKLLLFYSLLCLASVSYAQSTQQPQKHKIQTQAKTGEFHFSLLLGNAQIENPLVKQADLKLNALPSFYYYGDKFYVENTSIGYAIYESDQLLVDLAGQLNDDGILFQLDNPKDYTLFNIVGIRPSFGRFNPDEISRKLSYLAGINLTLPNELISARIGYFTDITGVHHGQQLNLAFFKDWQWQQFSLYTELGASFKSHEIVNYYYRLKSVEINGKSQDSFEGKNAVNKHAKVQLTWPFSDHISLVLMANYHWLDSKISNSFLVQKTHYLSSFVGIEYRF